MAERGRSRRDSGSSRRTAAARILPWQGYRALAGEALAVPRAGLTACPSPARGRSHPGCLFSEAPGTTAWLRLQPHPLVPFPQNTASGCLQPGSPALTQSLEELVEILAAPHLPSAGEVGHGGAGAADGDGDAALLLCLRLRHLVSGADRGGGWESGSHPPGPPPLCPGLALRRQTGGHPPSIHPSMHPSIHHSLSALQPASCLLGLSSKDSPTVTCPTDEVELKDLLKGPRSRQGRERVIRIRPALPCQGIVRHHTLHPKLPMHRYPRLAACTPTNPAPLIWVTTRPKRCQGVQPLPGQENFKEYATAPRSEAAPLRRMTDKAIQNVYTIS